MKYLLSLFIFISSLNVFSQIEDPIKWSTSVEKLSDSTFVLVSEAIIEEGWHLYAQEVPQDGPIPTSFSFDTSQGGFLLEGKTQEENGVVVDDAVFQMKIKFFEKKTVFKQKVKVLKGIETINAFVEFMVCDDTKCLSPTEVDLVFDLKIKANKENSKSLEKSNLSVALDHTAQENENSDLLSLFLLSFFAGLAALLTPCVFPMIPMTVSFFTKQSKTKAIGIRNAIFFGFSIIIIYVVIGLAVSAIFGPSALNALSTNIWFNLLFFLLLVFFAASFLGAFELVLPSSWGTKIDAKADKGGYVGIFFMALALAIVSFSCTGPLVGSALVAAATTGERVAPIVSMLGFSTAIALPFALFAAFPGWLNSLPKSGGWLNTVKVVLGFLELALAFKFLSNVDLVLQLHLLEREVFIAIWIAIFGVLSVYLFGKIQLPHDTPLKHISVGRLFLGLVSLTFTIYMIPGLWGAPLNIISAFPPPQHYSESPYGVGFTNSSNGKTTLNTAIPEGAHLMAPHNILAFNDYDKGMAYAKKVGKPVLLDFTGHACVNCRKMEQNVWVKPTVLQVIKNDVVLISLYVDDKRPLKEAEITESKLKPGKKLKYIGQKWSELQTIKYQTNTQPFYVLLNHNEEPLNRPVAYTPDVNVYYNWLKTGISNFK
ncbi:cytochrome c biogenesis protein CcdA [uncultured Polaribacter sp.]|uniref:protein-disulfide reductase DsbD family protein n=1 Tax=uncultured Polaribacter sp. TaxID=174711 RepID=UPI00260A9903|nr:cytochrome c biogenesis protein CcdA [uncultured Polaribacter sp.]